MTTKQHAFIKQKFKLAAISAVFGFTLSFSSVSSAYCDGCVVAAVHQGSAMITAAVNGVNGSIIAMNTSVSQLLFNLGIAVNQNGSKISAAIEANGKILRDFATEQARNSRMEEANRRYRVHDSICSDAGSAGASRVGSSSGATQTTMRPGGGAATTNPRIDQAINSPPPASEIDAARSAQIHVEFCDNDDYAAYGGSTACPQVSNNMPGADKRLDSVFFGAGPDGKDPDLTFTPEQTDVARMYTQNSVRRSISAQLTRGEAESTAGSQYIGMMNQYSSILSAAATPQDRVIARSQPNPVTKDLLNEIFVSPSAKAYFELIGSAEAKRTGMMSAREFEAFEVGRRYSNVEYQADLQEMSEDNLMREQIRVLSQANWLLLEMKNDIELNNVLLGQILASVAREEYQPLLTQKRREVTGSLGGGQ